MLACVDEGGNVYIWVIHEKNGKLEYPFLTQLLSLSNGFNFWQLSTQPFCSKQGSQITTWSLVKLILVPHKNFIQRVESLIEALQYDVTVRGDGFKPMLVKNGKLLNIMSAMTVIQ